MEFSSLFENIVELHTSILMNAWSLAGVISFSMLKLQTAKSTSFTILVAQFRLIVTLKKYLQRNAKINNFLAKIPQSDGNSIVRLVLLFEFIESKLEGLVACHDSSRLQLSGHGHEVAALFGVINHFYTLSLNLIFLLHLPMCPISSILIPVCSSFLVLLSFTSTSPLISSSPY